APTPREPARPVARRSLPVRRRSPASAAGRGWSGAPRRLTTEHRIGHGTAVAAVSGGVDLAGVPEVAAVEVGPQRVEEDHLRVGGLPEQEVGRALLPR